MKKIFVFAFICITVLCLFATQGMMKIKAESIDSLKSISSEDTIGYLTFEDGYQVEVELLNNLYTPNSTKVLHAYNVLEELSGSGLSYYDNKFNGLYIGITCL